ncbi:MAG TPA: DedA family protein [Candidatus Limnocylindrales bacterium]|nr:DedA family protein [Candidatus Limnocylindrales bacterium]
MGSSQNFGQLRRKAPRLILIALAVVVVIYFVIDFLVDVVIGGAPVTSEPIISFILYVTRGVTATVRAFGYSGIFVLMLLESSSVPIPSEVILPFAGYLSLVGQLNFWIILIVATIAGILGSLVDYYIGLRGVQSLIKNRVWGKVLLSAAQLEATEKWFSKYGDIMVFVSRLIPGFRTTFSFPAGAVRMPLKKFLALTTAGCFLWNAVLVYLGWYLGENWRWVAGVSRYIILAAVAAAVIVIAVYLVMRRRKTRQG